MKRSEINAIIEHAKELLAGNNMRLPPFAYWTPEEWRDKGAECDEIRKCLLGWDVTDFGGNDFDRLGLTIFTVRNGHHTIDAYKDKTYCEKILIVREKQITPMHCHSFKMEDIIVRAGGNMVIKCYNHAEGGGLDDADITVALDGVRRTLKAGEELVLRQGESITLTPYLYHEFWGEPGSGICIVGEVSKVNDDNADNIFHQPLPRFPEIEEDCPPTHLLCTEY